VTHRTVRHVDALRRRLIQSALAVPLLGAGRAVAAALGYPRLMQGPMIGAATPDSLRVWARAGGPLPVSVEYAPDRMFLETSSTPAVVARAEDDYTVRIDIRNLAPNTRYWYRVRVDGQVDRYQKTPYAVRTAPLGTSAFRVAFGSCARVQVDADQRIFHAVRAAEPDLFFWLGDNIYGDSDQPQVLAEEYRRQRKVDSLAPLLASVPQLATWDDHDFGLNNADRTNPAREGSLRVFRDYWANPGAGLDGVPGVFFLYQYGGVDFFFLDGRYHRDPNAQTDGPTKTMLGITQKNWLKAGLRASKAPFKVLVSGSGWSLGDGPQGDTWAAFRHERDELFDFIRDHDIGGVVLLSGDTHVGELNCMRWSERGGYDLYDLVSSPLAQPPSETWPELQPEHRVRSPFVRSTNFGVLDFSWHPEPQLTFTLRDTRGDAVWVPLTLTASELRNGRATCDEKSRIP
jgi:alkaline phosphatase D